jgi:hypothetical protein
LSSDSIAGRFGEKRLLLYNQLPTFMVKDLSYSSSSKNFQKKLRSKDDRLGKQEARWMLFLEVSLFAALCLQQTPPDDGFSHLTLAISSYPKITKNSCIKLQEVSETVH